MDFAAVVDGTPARDALVMNVVAHVGGVPIQVMNADGVLATGAVNGTLRLWDVSQGALIVELERDMDSLPFVAFSPDGEYLYYSDLGQAGYVIRRFALDPEQLVALAESRVTRELTEDECRRFPSAPPCG
jgi:WD40 repeat protein